MPNSLPLAPWPLSAERLAVAFTIVGQNAPTPAQLAAALLAMHPTGSGPTVDDLLAAGQLVFTLDGKYLRVPALTEARPHRQAPNQTVAPVAPTAPTTPAVHLRVAKLFSFYEGGGIVNTKPTATLTPAGLYKVLVSDRYRARTEALRAAAAGSTERKNIKRNLDSVTPAGVFNYRANHEVRSLSGLMVLDFDHLPDVGAARAALLADKMLAPDLVMIFVSPSGDGLKAIVWTDSEEDHLSNFRAYADYLKAHYATLGLVPDEAGKDVARACFVPHDPNAWLAPDATATP